MDPILKDIAFWAFMFVVIMFAFAALAIGLALWKVKKRFRPDPTFSPMPSEDDDAHSRSRRVSSTSLAAGMGGGMGAAVAGVGVARDRSWHDDEAAARRRRDEARRDDELNRNNSGLMTGLVVGAVLGTLPNDLGALSGAHYGMLSIQASTLKRYMTVRSKLISYRHHIQRVNDVATLLTRYGIAIVGKVEHECIIHDDKPEHDADWEKSWGIR